MGFLSNQKERATKYEEDLEKKRQEFLSTRIAGIKKIVFDIVGGYPDKGSVRFKRFCVDGDFYFEVDGVEFSYSGDRVKLKGECIDCGRAVWSASARNPKGVVYAYEKMVESAVCQFCLMDGGYSNKSVFDYMRDWWNGCFG